MSRTRHHRNQKSQHQGEDFWSKRAGMGSQSVCSINKEITARKERMEDKEIIIQELKLIDERACNSDSV